VRWIGRFAQEMQGAELHDLRRAVDAFEAMPDPEARATLERLAAMATR
jgi:hypothetical protein